MNIEDIPLKVKGSKHTAEEFNTVKAAVIKNKVDLTKKAPLVDGFVPIDNIPEIPEEKIPVGYLTPSQFEKLSNGQIGIRTDYLESLNLGGKITPEAPTNPIVNDVKDTFTVTPPIGYIGADLETQIKTEGVWGAWQVNTSVSFKVGNVAIPAGDIQSRVKAAPGRFASDPVASLQPFTVSDGEQYEVEFSYRVNLANEYGSPPTGGGFNTYKPSNELLEEEGGYTSPFIVSTDGYPSGMKLSNSGAFSGSSSMISEDQDALGDVSVYPNTVVNSAWNVNGGTDAKIRISGLNPDKYYQIYGLMPVGNADSVRSLTIGGVEKRREATSILGSFPLAENGLNDPEFIVFNNISGTEIEISVKRVSGDYGAYLACLVIEQSNIEKP